MSDTRPLQTLPSAGAPLAECSSPSSGYISESHQSKPERSEANFLQDIICGDRVEILKTLPAKSVHLTVTSPPYNCGKNYGVSDSVTWEEYWRATEAWLEEVLRVTVAGGRLAVNLPWWMGKKPRRDVPFEFQRIACGMGWLKLDKIIWVKGDENNVHTSGGWGGGGCGWGTYLSPSGPSIRCASESILIFAKGSRGRKIISGAGRGACVHGDITKDEWMEWTKDVWFVRGGSDKNHPAVFPPEIPKRLIKLYTYPGDVVLDLHNGSGTTTEAAQLLGRQFIGVDVNAAYCENARTRTGAVAPPSQEYNVAISYARHSAAKDAEIVTLGEENEGAALQPYP